MAKKLPYCGLVPLSNYVVVLLDRPPTETVSPGGIIVPPAAVKPAREGVVIAAGPGVVRPNGRRVLTIARPGDRVMVSGRASTPYRYDGIEFALMREPEIDGIIVQAVS